MLAVCLIVVPAFADDERIQSVSGKNCAVNKYFSVRPGTGWYETRMDINSLFSPMKGMKKTYLYTGKEAAEPTEENVRCTVILAPRSARESAEVCLKDVEAHDEMLLGKDHRRGDLPLGDRSVPCYLSPEHAEAGTVYSTVLSFDEIPLIAVVHVPKPKARFPVAAVRLLETITVDAAAVTRAAADKRAKKAQKLAKAKEEEKKPEPVEEETEEETTGNETADTIIEFLDMIEELIED